MEPLIKRISFSLFTSLLLNVTTIRFFIDSQIETARESLSYFEQSTLIRQRKMPKGFANRNDVFR